MRVIAAVIGLVCIAPAGAAPSDTLATMIARALSYYSEAGSEKRYSISNEWRALSGETVICARADIPNGAGGWSPTSDFSMFFLSDGVIANMVKDNSLFGCTNRHYEPLEPITMPMSHPSPKIK
jgi:hypothetical protein